MESIFPASDKSGMGHSDSPSGIKERQMLGFGKFFFPFPWDKQTKKKPAFHLFALSGTIRRGYVWFCGKHITFFLKWGANRILAQLSQTPDILELLSYLALDQHTARILVLKENESVYCLGL